MLAVIILAAGESRRMGRPKALLPFREEFPFHLSKAGNRFEAQAAGAALRSSGQATSAPTKQETRAADKTFLCHLMDVTRHPRTCVLRVVVGAHAVEIRTSAKLDAEELVVNEDWRSGQLSSLQAGIRSLPKDATEGILVCPVDHPLISSNLVTEIIAAFDKAKNKIVIPVFRGRRGHPVIFPSAFYEELLAAPPEIGARFVVRAHAADVMEIPVEEQGVVLNLNDPESLEKLSNPEATV